MNTTTSDIDSQPATPTSQTDHNENANEPLYTCDGLFKIPRARCDSQTSQSDYEYVIARQTRSQVSLTEIPLEAIEKTFHAPDAPLDFYHTDPHDNPDYLNFLSELFTSSSTANAEIDEDADPDYRPRNVQSHPSKLWNFAKLSKISIENIVFTAMLICNPNFPTKIQFSLQTSTKI